MSYLPRRVATTTSTRAKRNEMEFLKPDFHDSEIRLVLRETRAAVPEKNYVPAYSFNIELLDGTHVGECSLRVGHNRLTYFGGNIGYGIDEPFRGHRYASKACRLLFELAVMHNMDYVLITCSVDNPASSRSIQLAGGMLIATEDVPEDTEQYERGSRRVLVYKILLHDMRSLFCLDVKDYDDSLPIRNRHSVRGIIIKGSKIAMAHVTRFGYYKFPGGGSEGTETKVETLVREVREESGLVVKPETARPYGLVTRTQRSRRGEKYNQDNFYYLCEVKDEISKQELTESEAENGYVLEFVDPKVAIEASRATESAKDRFAGISIERECRVLETLISEGYFLN